MNESALMEPALSATEWWKGSDDRWYPPYDGRSYALPQWHAPVVREPGLPVGKSRNPWAVVGLSLITLGIYRIYWEYRSFKDLKSFTGEGLGARWGLAFAIVFPIVNSFLLPSEVGRIFTGENKLEPVSAASGLLVFIPLVGWIVWTVMTQKALNEIWASYTSGESLSA